MPVFKRFSRISLLYLLSFEATNVLIEKERSASYTLSVPTAESFLPVKGNTSGPLWHKLLRFTRQTRLTKLSIKGANV